MNFTAPVTPPPAPVATTHVDFRITYFVVRGDGCVKILNSLCEKNDTWLQPGSAPLYGNLGGNGMTPEVMVPVDLLTALRLGLIQESELELPEGVRALFNMIK